MKQSLNDYLTENLATLAVSNRLREFPSITQDGVYLTMQGKRYLSFASNDYLGIAENIRKLAFPKEMSWSGAKASRAVTGNHPLYAEAETKLAEMKGTEAALIFTSGYTANIGTIPALVGKGDIVLLDRLSHACMIDSVRLSGAAFHRFHHNDIVHLETLLKKHRASHRHCLILTETIFSMDGDIAPLPAISALAKEHNAWLMTDDAHGLGLPLPFQNPADVQMGTFSKAAGMLGGYVCGSQQLRSWLCNAARSQLFSTALPEMVLYGILTALTLLRQETWRAETVMRYANELSTALKLPAAQSPIIPVIFGSNEAALAAQQHLMEKAGIYAPAIRPPTVPENTARLRLSLSAAHEETHIRQLVSALTETQSCILF